MGDRVGSFEKMSLKKNLREVKQVFAGKAWNRARLVHWREGEAECGPSKPGETAWEGVPEACPWGVPKICGELWHLLWKTQETSGGFGS